MRIHWPKPLFLPGEKKLAIILLHAYTGSSSDMRLVALALNQAGYPVLVPHFTGHATAEPLDILQKGSVDRWWQDTVAAIHKLQDQGYDQIACFGLSLGSLFALKAILTKPVVVGGGVISAPLFASDLSAVTRKFPQYAQKVYRYTDVDQETMATKLAQIKKLLPPQLAQIKAFAAQEQEELDQLTKPLFIAQGGADEIVDPQAALTLKEKLRDKDISWHWYPNARHVLTVNRAHQQLQSDLLTFLTQNFKDDNEVLNGKR